MKRYHRSCIGLMEQCNDGEWIKFEDHESERKEYIRYRTSIDDSRKQHIRALNDENDDLLTELLWYTKLAHSLGYVNVLLVSALALYWVYT